MDLVEAWLLHHGVERNAIGRNGAGDWLTLSIPVSLAEMMLDAKYSVFRNPVTDSYVVRTTEYSLPAELHEHVQVIAPTTYFGGMRAMRATSHLSLDAPLISPAEADAQRNALDVVSAPPSCATTITPACLKALYNTTSYTPQATDTNKIGIAGYLDYYANDADLQVRLSLF